MGRELVLDFSPREKLNENLPATFVIRSRRFARFQHLTNISVIMYETVSPDIFSAPPREMNAAFLEPFSFFQLPVQKCSTLCWYSSLRGRLIPFPFPFERLPRRLQQATGIVEFRLH